MYLYCTLLTAIQGCIFPYSFSEICSATLPQWKGGYSEPKLEKRRKIAEVLGVTVDQLDGIEPQINTELDAGRAGGIASLIKTASKVVPRLINTTLDDLKKVE